MKLAWLLFLLAAGTAAVAGCRATAPPTVPRDFFDSPWLLPSFLGLAAACALAGWTAPAWAALYGPAAVAPFYVVLTATVVRHHPDGLFLVGFGFLTVLSLLPLGAGIVAGRLRG